MRLLFDLETDGLLEDVTKIHCLVIKDFDTKQVYRYRPSHIREGIEHLLKADELIGHNIIGYDMPVLDKLYPLFSYTKKITDTLVCSRLIWTDISEIDFALIRKGVLTDKSLIGRHSLEAWGHRLGILKDSFGKTSDWSEFSEEMLDYCVQDVEVTDHLYSKILSKDYSQPALDLEHSVAKIIHDQTCYGFYFDIERAQILCSELLAKRLKLLNELTSIFPPIYVSLGEFTPKRDNKRVGYVADCPLTKIKLESFNPASTYQISSRLIRKYKWKPKSFTVTGLPIVDDHVLQTLPYKEAKILADYQLIKKRLGQLAEGRQGWLKLVKDSRLYGRVNSNGTVTGRMTHFNPNIAQVPAVGVAYGKECRSLFTVPKGKVLVGADASGLELRCLAHYLTVYDQGLFRDQLLDGDIHSLNQKLVGLSSREQAKRFIYAFLYGAGPDKIGLIVGGNRQTGLRLIKRFFDKAPAIKLLREAVSKKATTPGYLKGLDGRLIHLRSRHAALNSLLQSAGGILMKQAQVILSNDLTLQGFKQAHDYAFVATVHDEWEIECDEEKAETIGQLAVDAIKKAGRHFNFRCPLDGSYKIGQDWASTH